MSTAEITKSIAHGASHRKDKFIGVYYLLTIVTGGFVLFFHGRLAFAADIAVGILYLLVTALLYGMSLSSHGAKEQVHKEDV